MFNEKYRPKSLNDVVGQKHIVSVINKMIEKEEIPHLLFAGKAGTGKTTIAKIIAKEIYGDEYRSYFLDMNASDDRGINVIRNKVKSFARMSTIDNKKKIIFLDEADSLTQDAQQALRRIMEDYEKICRFIISCNYPNKIIDPIIGRTVLFQFTSITPIDMLPRLKYIAENEGIIITEEAILKIANMANGKMRNAINLLEQMAVLDVEITVDLLHEHFKLFYVDDGKKLIKSIKNGLVNDIIYEFLNNGYNYEQILDFTFDYLKDNNIVDKTISTSYAKYGYYMAMGTNPKICLIALFNEIKPKLLNRS